MKHKAFSGDELRISQILLNLASNAVKYTQEGGSIALVVQELAKTRPSYASVAFTITDNGMGMSPEFVERIFDPFERSEEVSIARIQGTGLGDVHNEGADRRHGRHCRGRQRKRTRQLVSRDIGTSRRLVGGCLSALEVVPESTSIDSRARGFSWPRTTS